MSEEFDWDGKDTPYKMRLLDHFAGLAMQAVILSYIKDRMPPQTISELAYEMAAEMMTEREHREAKKQEEIENTMKLGEKLAKEFIRKNQ